MSNTQTIERPETGTDIAILGTVTALTVFGADGGVDAILKRITAQARAVETDISTPGGRKAVASLAYKIARSKTALDAMGKDLGEQNYRAWKAITADRSRIEKALDALADEVRKPLTDWENAEKARIAAHEAALAALVEGPQFYAADNPSEDLARRLRYLETALAEPSLDWQEFAKRAADILAAEIAKTKVALLEAVRREAEAERAARVAQEEAEAERARKAERQRQRLLAAVEKAQQEEAERARIAAEETARRAKAEAEALATRVELDRQAEALARRQAEQKARDDAAALAAQVEARAKADADHLAAVERQKQEAQDRAIKAEAARLAAIAKAEQDAHTAAIKAEADRREAADNAAAAERKRIADEQARDAAETARREANKRHRAAVNNEALADLVAATEITQAAARAVITAVVSGKVRHMGISY